MGTEEKRGDGKSKSVDEGRRVKGKQREKTLEDNRNNIKPGISSTQKRKSPIITPELLDVYSRRIGCFCSLLNSTHSLSLTVLQIQGQKSKYLIL